MPQSSTNRGSLRFDGLSLSYDAHDEDGTLTRSDGGFVCDPGPCSTQFLQATGALTTFPVSQQRTVAADLVATDGRQSGFIELSAYGANSNPFLNEASGNVYVGAPAIMLIQRTYRNGQLQDADGNNVRANYSDILSMRRTVRVDEPLRKWQIVSTYRTQEYSVHGEGPNQQLERNPCQAYRHSKSSAAITSEG